MCRFCPDEAFLPLEEMEPVAVCLFGPDEAFPSIEMEPVAVCCFSLAEIVADSVGSLARVLLAPDFDGISALFFWASRSEVWLFSSALLDPERPIPLSREENRI